jgi:hypothetical protein
VVNKDIQTLFTTQSSSDWLGLDNGDKAQADWAEYDDIVPSWLMDNVSDMELQNMAVGPGICETSLSALGFPTATQFDEEWLNTSRMVSDMARVTEMDTPTNYDFFDRVIPEFHINPNSGVASNSSVSPPSKVLLTERKSSSSELVSTSMDLSDSTHGEDDGSVSSLGSNMGYDGKDISGAWGGGNEAGAIQTAHFEVRSVLIDRAEVPRQVSAMTSAAKLGLRDKTALLRSNKEKIGSLVSRGLELSQIEEELQKDGCRITTQLREYIIWEKRVPEVRELLAQGLDVTAIEERMRLNGWIWTDNLKKKALWEFHSEEIISHYKSLRSVEAVREIMAKKGFTPQ